MAQKTWQKIKSDPALLDQYLVREQVYDEIRRFFKAQDFREIETPLLVERPSTETYLEFFQTELELADGTRRIGFLTTSPEYALKKVLAAGLPRIFQLCKSFRNQEGRSRTHNPEFTILEWYRTQADYTDIMTDCEELFMALLQKLGRDTKPLQFQGRSFDLTRPWLRLSVAEAFEKYVGISADTLVDDRALVQVAKDHGYQVDATTTWEEAYNQLFLNKIDPALAELTQPVFLYDYPASQAALSRRKSSDPRFAERFEWYIGGIELGNAFSELTDATEQEARLREDLAFRRTIGKKHYELDEDFIEALRAGIPTTGGIAVGVDRLIMLLADVPSIHETMFFPYFDVFEV